MGLYRCYTASLSVHHAHNNVITIYVYAQVVTCREPVGKPSRPHTRRFATPLLREPNSLPRYTRISISFVKIIRDDASHRRVM